MGYTALYRKFRPDTFEDVKGQDHIVKTLKNQIRADRAGHAYLFCGTRGTGKTTIAKILAKAVNCEHPIDGSPCPYDRVLSTRIGVTAAKMILDEEYGYMVGIVNGKMKKVPLAEVSGKLKMVSPKDSIIQEAKLMGISFGD